MSLSSSFSDLLMNSNNTNNSLTISHVRNASTSPKRIQLKDQIIQQLTTLISLELSKIDSRDIETKLSLFFNLSENNEAKEYINSLCSKITEMKKNINIKVKNFLNHNINALIDNIENGNNNMSDNDLVMKNKFKLILKEIKTLNNNSRIKFKKLYDNLSNEYDKIFSTVYDYLQKGNTKLVIDRLNRVEQLKNDVLFDVTSIENIENKFTDSIKNIINKINIEQSNNNNIGNEIYKINKKNNNNNTRHSLGRTKTAFTFNKNNNSNSNSKILNNDYSYNKNDNSLYSKLSKNKYEISNFNTYGNINNNKEESEVMKVYRMKIKEKKNEIEKLKQQLQLEKESKNKAIEELNKLQYINKMTLTIKNSQKNATNEEKFSKLTEMIINFTYSMNNLRNNLYQKTISHINAKNIYGKLKNELMSLVEEVSSLKNSIVNNDNKENLKTDINEEDIEENNADIKTIKEENENSQILTDRDKDFNKSIENNNIDYNNDQQTRGNIVNNNITLNTLPNYNMQVLLEENKNLRNQLSQKIYNSQENVLNNDQDKNLIESLKKQIIDLKKIIVEKDQEIEDKRANSIKSEKNELNNIIINNTKNIEQLKTTYQLLIDGKDNRIKELEEEIISYEKEIDRLKEENDKLKNEFRKDKILSEAEVNKLKNQKIELQCLLEQGGSGNNLVNINNKEDKEKIKKMENELNIKNKQIILLTQNHENDLKELNLAIEMLKHKIIQLEEENVSLSSAINKENIIENDKNY